MITPTTQRERASRIIAATTGFIYYVSVAGITGERKELPPDIVDNLTWIREQTDLPICVGFGIGSPEQAQQLAPHCDGLIVGSAIIRRIDESVKKDTSITESVSEFCNSILEAIG